MFDGIYYSGVTPESRAFETYFGIEIIEARYAFCYNSNGEGASVTFSRTGGGPLQSKEYVDCLYTPAWYSCRERAEYVEANTYRSQLRNAMTQSLVSPYVPPAAEVQKTCSWEKFVGPNDNRATAQINNWLSQGFTIGAEIESLRMCSAVTAPLSGVTGQVTLAAYRCR
jgi:hypothetical protein